MASYHSNSALPPLVERAHNLAEQMEYSHSCSVETGRFLQLSAALFQSGVIGELGTGCGVGAAWIVSALSPSTSFFTVEMDVSRAAAARALFDPLFNVRVIQGDWRELISNWRFSMLYVGGTDAAIQDPESLIHALRVGGLIVLDKLTPRAQLPLGATDLDDPVRSYWLNDPRMLATEVLVSPAEAVLLAVRSG
jgi:predicted O-methyltransferase YrrM